ncbi:MAG TPA: NfeD family protein [Pirellulales bacterium]
MRRCPLRWPAKAKVLAQLLAAVFTLAFYGSMPLVALAQEGANEAKSEAPAAAVPAPERRAGRMVRVPMPITDKVDNQIRRVVDSVLAETKRAGQWPVFIFEIEPGRANFGEAYDLANFLSGPALNGATTVAWIPKTISGHAVLVAMACDEIVMSPEAEIGKAGEYEKVIEPSVRNAYVGIANRRMNIPSDVALALLDPAVELVMVETDVSREYALASRLDELRKQKSFEKPKVIKPAGQPGIFTGNRAWELGFVKSLAASRADVAKALGLPREAVEADPSLDGDWRPVRIDIRGPITSKLAEQTQALIQNQIQDHDANFFCLWIDSEGGSATDSINLANFLTSLDPGERRTVAYIPNAARADAAFIALAADQIVMHPKATLGGRGDMLADDVDVKLIAGSLRDIAKRKGRAPAIAAAMIDPSVTVYRYTRVRDALIDYFTPEDLAAQGDADGWQQGAEIGHRGQPLELTGQEAEQYGVARYLARDFEELKNLYGLEGDPALVEPSWAHILIDALNSPGISWLLLLVGGAALYAELQAPGIGLGGLISALCFLLYFWIAYLGGTAGWLEVLLFLAGVVCLMLEIFVLPGVGVFGLAGGLLVIVSLVLASQTFVLPRNAYQVAQLRNSLLALTSVGAGVVALAILMNRYLPHAPMFNRMMLAPPTPEELSVIHQREAVARFEHLVGMQGVTTTPLLPSGKAQIGDELVDVIADGEVIERNQPVRVVEVRGNRVLVRQVA